MSFHLMLLQFFSPLSLLRFWKTWFQRLWEITRTPWRSSTFSKDLWCGSFESIEQVWRRGLGKHLVEARAKRHATSGGFIRRRCQPVGGRRSVVAVVHGWFGAQVPQQKSRNKICLCCFFWQYSLLVILIKLMKQILFLFHRHKNSSFLFGNSVTRS